MKTRIVIETYHSDVVCLTLQEHRTAATIQVSAWVGIAKLTVQRKLSSEQIKTGVAHYLNGRFGLRGSE